MRRGAGQATPGRPGIAFRLFVAIFAVILSASRGAATEEIAGATGRPCGECHVDRSGGGELTGAGKAFLRAEGGGRGASPVSAPIHRGVRLAAGFLHLLTAVMWFGTILYVHLLLKPAYASRGLPRGELFVGWGSIVLIAATGLVLTLYRVPSWDALFHSRFGRLLTAKIAIYLVMTSTAFIVTFAVGPRLKARRAAVGPRKRDMTPEELAACSGNEGAPAYVAYKGTIYDASGSRLWKGGSHLGKHQAGFDLTDAMKQAPHGEDRIMRLPAVGKLLSAAVPERMPAHLKAFYFMTYFNLVLVLAVLMIIAVWRWG